MSRDSLRHACSRNSGKLRLHCSGGHYKMTKKHCCYGLCTSDSRYVNKSHMQGVFFINFPKPKTQPEKCSRWIRLCGRPVEKFHSGRVNRNTFICSKHFVGGNGPTAEHPDPIPALATHIEVQKLSRPKRKAPTDRTHEDWSSKHRRFEAAEALLSLGKSDPTVRHVHDDMPPEALTPVTERGTQTCAHEHPSLNRDAASQTVYEKHVLQSMIALRKSFTTNQQNSQRDTRSAALQLKELKEDDKQMKFFTGLLYFQFIALFNFLGPCVNNLKYWGQSAKKSVRSARKTAPTDELFICLVRLRRGYCFTTLSFLFGLSETTLRRIFTTWLQLLYHHFNDLRAEMFPDRATLKKFMPKSFAGFKNVRCSVDCTEFFCEMPRDFSRQGNLYSSYKSHHTFKCLIAVAPNGTGVFVSDLFEGGISDREIFERCGILNHLNPGDLLLVDRGFTVEDLLLSRQVHMNIPPFLKGRDKLTPREELLTKKNRQGTNTCRALQ